VTVYETTSQYWAEHVRDKYAAGTRITLFVNPQDQCSADVKGMRDVGVTGIAFLSAAALVLLIVFALCSVLVCRSIKRTIPAPTTEILHV
jgi:hypothetical protein